MSTSGLMSIGLRAMLANNASLQVTGHNIANANVDGYSRQDAVLATNTGQFSGAGFFGKGSSVVDVRRAHDNFLTMQSQAAKALSAMEEAKSGQLQQLEDIFPSGTQGLGYAMGDFLGTMVDLANTPSDNSARQVVLARAADVAARFSTASARIDILQAGVRADLQTSATTVNGLAARIADLNQQIATVNGLDQKPNDLLDQRDALVGQLSQLIQVTTLPASDGTVGVFIAGGQRLVLGTEASQLTVTQADLDPSRAALAVTTNGQSLALSEGMLTGGSMAGLLRFQNQDLVDARNRIGQMATAFATQVNEAQAKGLNLGDPPGPGSDLFTLGAPTALPAAHNARDASGNVIGSVSIAVTDSSLLQASDYTLENDPSGSGQFLLVRLSDGLSRSVNDGDTVDGFQITAGSPGPQAGDRFLLQPVAHAATGMTRALDDPSGIAAASPVTATMGTGNTGTASIASLTVTSAAIDTTVDAQISFTSGTGDYTWELRDPLTGNVTSSGTGTWTAGQPISLNGFELRLNGVPAAGDTVSVAKTQFPATSNGNALQMAALRDATSVGRTVQADGSIAPGSTYTDAYANAMADVGVRVQSAKMSAQISAAVSTEADATLGAKTGVNLDEEAARLIQFQQSYQAAAKVLEVAQKVFDTMLQISGA